MTGLSHLNAPLSVPYRHKVSAVAHVAAVNLNLEAPLNPFPNSNDAKAKSNQANASSARGRYSAQAAAPGFAAQILVEAGLSGSDPFAATRAASAYGHRPMKAGALHLTV
jgi:hypothetical protein